MIMAEPWRKYSYLLTQTALIQVLVIPEASYKSQGRVLIGLENSFLSLIDENIRATTPLSAVNTL
jgi:hypothetical protein